MCKHFLILISTSTPSVLLGTPESGGVWELVHRSGPMVKLVLLLLFALSIATWGIILFKYLQLRIARNRSVEFLDIFWERKRLEVILEETEHLTGSSLLSLFKSGYQELMKIKRGKGSPPPRKRNGNHLRKRWESRTWTGPSAGPPPRKFPGWNPT